jgi:hypothetical protein
VAVYTQGTRSGIVVATPVSVIELAIIVVPANVFMLVIVVVVVVVVAPVNTYAIKTIEHNLFALA